VTPRDLAAERWDTPSDLSQVAVGEDGSTSMSASRLPRLNVLLVSHAFPPNNLIGAVRVGKFAKYLYDAGHSVRVITAVPANNSLPLEIPAERVVFAREWARDGIFDNAVRWVRQLRRGLAADSGPAGLPSPGERSAGTGWRTRLQRHYYAALRIPDARAGWISAATAAGREVVRGWRPDVVIGSAPPNSGLVAAKRIARACAAPWIAELRDLWVDNPYYENPAWRRLLDRAIERRVLRSAAGLVSVTPQWSETLRRRYRQPVACIFNGYVAADFPADVPGPAAGGTVNILYTGNIYSGYRDPSPLFAAIGRLGAERRRVAVHFYGPPPAAVMPLAAAHGAADRVFVHQPVAYKASLALQTAADVLLLLQWNHQKDAGNIPAKFFEYIAARRPILFLGYEAGDLAAMIRERGAGLVANDPEAITDALRRWIADKQKPAGIPSPPAGARLGLTRDEQNQKYERFLADILLR
jgi:glycosyltransferase involved in cell wall biosynthesis